MREIGGKVREVGMWWSDRSEYDCGASDASAIYFKDMDEMLACLFRSGMELLLFYTYGSDLAR